MKKILLIYPMSRSADTIEHIGLGYIASALRQKNHQVKLFVYQVNQNTQALLEEIKLVKPDFIGFTTFIESMANIIEVCKIIKNIDKSIKIVFGGHAAAQEAEDILANNDCVDYIAQGEGEITLCELLDSYDDSIRLKEVAGIVYRLEDKEIRFNQPRESISDLDSLAFPARDIYKEAEVKPPIALLSTSRGCLGHCSFCSYSSKRNAGTAVWRGRSPENVVDEIEQLVKEYGMSTFFITDVTYEDPGPKGKKRIEAIAREIIKRNLDISYEVHMRAENWTEKDQSLLELLFESGLESVVVGIESGSAKTLDVYSKIATPQDNVRIVKLLKNAHISLEYGFIMFQPYTSFEDCYENIQFFYNTGLGYNIKCILTRLEVYPGVSIEAKLAQDGLLEKGSFKEGNIFNYRFVDERIKVLSDSLCELPLKVPSIEEFDLVNTRLRILLARIWRRLYAKGLMQDEIIQFADNIDKLSMEMMKNNTEFLDECLKLAKSTWSDDIFNSLVKSYIIDYLPQKIEEVKRLQFDFWRKLNRNKIDISKLKF